MADILIPIPLIYNKINTFSRRCCIYGNTKEKNEGFYIDSCSDEVFQKYRFRVVELIAEESNEFSMTLELRKAVVEGCYCKDGDQMLLGAHSRNDSTYVIKKYIHIYSPDSVLKDIQSSRYYREYLYPNFNAKLQVL